MSSLSENVIILPRLKLDTQTSVAVLQQVCSETMASPSSSAAVSLHGGGIGRRPHGSCRGLTAAVAVVIHSMQCRGVEVNVNHSIQREATREDVSLNVNATVHHPHRPSQSSVPPSSSTSTQVLSHVLRGHKQVDGARDMSNL